MPTIFDSSHRLEVVCQNCSHIISRGGSEIGCWLGILDLAFAIIIWNTDISFGLFISLVLGVTVSLLVLDYFLVPFKDYGLKKN